LRNRKKVQIASDMDNFQQEFKASNYCSHCQSKKLLAEKGMLYNTKCNIKQSVASYISRSYEAIFFLYLMKSAEFDQGIKTACLFIQKTRSFIFGTSVL
jgi:hypothetical protein